MKELNTFRQFLNETKENVDELFGKKEDPIEKQASMVFSTIEFVDDLVSAGHVDKAFFDIFTEKMAEAYSSLMMGASPELQSKMGFEADVDLDENDAALDEVINEDDFKVGDKVTMKAGGDEMEILGSRRMFGNSTEAYKVKKADGEEVEYSANQLKKA